MGRVRRFSMVAGLVLAGAGAFGPGAAADGLPSGSGGPPAPNVGPEGVTALGSPSRYVSLALGRQTMVARIDRRGGQVTASRLISGAFTIPAVAYDGTPSGLSADGSTLVLIHPRDRFPQRRTTLSVIDAQTLGRRDVINLHGDFSFDAISPDGATLYLVQYLSPIDPTRYAVRAYEMRTQRLLRAPIVDPHEAAEKMAGRPQTRVLSPDGRWAYTLYDGSGKAPFVHALDTVGRAAVCIEMPQLAGPGAPPLSTLSLGVDEGGGRLSVLDLDGRALLQTDTRTFEVTKPSAAASADRDFPLLWVLVVAAALVAAIGAVRWAKSRTGAAHSPAGG